MTRRAFTTILCLLAVGALGTSLANEAVLEFLGGARGGSGPASGGTAPVASEDAEIREAVKALRDAGLRRDVEALERFYAPEYFHTNADGSTMSRQQVLDSYRAKPAMTFTAVEADDWRSILRDTFAVASERNTVHGKTVDGHPFTSRYRITYILERRGGAWRFVSSHASLLGIDRNPPSP